MLQETRRLNEASRDRFRQEPDEKHARIAVYAVATADRMDLAEDELLKVRALAESLAVESGEVDERWNGTGPRGQAGIRIPLPDRIVALAAFFDDQTMGRGRPEGEVIAEVERLGGSWFDPLVVLAFLEVQPLIQPIGLNLGV